MRDVTYYSFLFTPKQCIRVTWFSSSLHTVSCKGPAGHWKSLFLHPPSPNSSRTTLSPLSEAHLSGIAAKKNDWKNIIMQMLGERVARRLHNGRLRFCRGAREKQRKVVQLYTAVIWIFTQLRVNWNKSGIFAFISHENHFIQAKTGIFVCT